MKLLEHGYVFVVLQHAHQKQNYATYCTAEEAIVHGVYTTREAANNKRNKVWDKYVGMIDPPYVSVLKLPIKGKSINIVNDSPYKGIFKGLRKVVYVPN